MALAVFKFSVQQKPYLNSTYCPSRDLSIGEKIKRAELRCWENGRRAMNYFQPMEYLTLKSVFPFIISAQLLTIHHNVLSEALPWALKALSSKSRNVLDSPKALSQLIGRNVSSPFLDL